MFANITTSNCRHSSATHTYTETNDNCYAAVASIWLPFQSIWMKLLCSCVGQLSIVLRNLFLIFFACPLPLKYFNGQLSLWVLSIFVLSLCFYFRSWPFWMNNMDLRNMIMPLARKQKQNKSSKNPNNHNSYSSNKWNQSTF